MPLHTYIAFLIFAGVACISSVKSQTVDLAIRDIGIQFADGTIQETSSAAQNPGSNQLVSVIAEFSNGIVGDVDLNGFDNHVQILKVYHEMYHSLNAMGFPTSPQHHRSFLLRKDVDRASPALYDHFNNNTLIDEVAIKYLKPHPSNGTIQEVYNIILSNVKISEYTTAMDFDAIGYGFFPSETLRLIYQTITFENLISGEATALPYSY